MNPDHAAVEVKQRSAGIAWLHQRRRLQHPPPTAVSHDPPEADHRLLVSQLAAGVAEADAGLIGHQRRRVAHRHMRQVGRRITDHEQRRIRPWIRAFTNAAEPAAIGQADAIPRSRLHSMAGREHMAIRADDHTAKAAAAAIDLHNSRPHAVNRLPHIELQRGDIKVVAPRDRPCPQRKHQDQQQEETSTLQPHDATP